MPKIVVATESDAIFDQVSSALDSNGTTLIRRTQGSVVAKTVLETHPDLVVLDLQIGNMGGSATCVALKQEAKAGRLPAVKVVLLLDRDVDEFVAEQSGADGWVVKPFTPRQLLRAAQALTNATAG